MPTTWFISRHPGALHWAEQTGIAYDRHLEHLELDQVQAGDRVIGSLPVNLAAEVCARGAEYHHLSLELPRALRGRELSAEQLRQAGARIRRYWVQEVGDA
ncbi:CRISPR-associated protein Csx16 [Magnetovirga frankeli]|uniref:CRISPR-associated protein Csx16 n=1 Tax=Magnetovirga frankeli TaxID=947516 RepID=UPI001293ACBE|nr:CRISPR-associated protein Csx16 [gamma proteobacterium SS-5]